MYKENKENKIKTKKSTKEIIENYYEWLSNLKSYELKIKAIDCSNKENVSKKDIDSLIFETLNFLNYIFTIPTIKEMYCNHVNKFIKNKKTKHFKSNISNLKSNIAKVFEKSLPELYYGDIFSELLYFPNIFETPVLHKSHNWNFEYLTQYGILDFYISCLDNLTTYSTEDVKSQLTQLKVKYQYIDFYFLSSLVSNYRLLIEKAVLYEDYSIYVVAYMKAIVLQVLKVIQQEIELLTKNYYEQDLTFEKLTQQSEVIKVLVENPNMSEEVAAKTISMKKNTFHSTMRQITQKHNLNGSGMSAIRTHFGNKKG